MNENTVNDTIQAVSEIISPTENPVDDSMPIWLWISIGELIIIIYLLFFKKKKKTLSVKEQFKKEFKDDEIDFDNIINSSFHVKPLYNDLKVKCHPDRFPMDEAMNKIADYIG